MCLYLLFKIASVKISLQVCMPRVPWSILCNTWLWRFFTNTYFDKGEATYLFFFSFRLSYQKVKFYISTLPYKRQTFLIKTETKGSAFCLFLFSGVLSVLQTWCQNRAAFAAAGLIFFVRMHFDGRNWRWQDFFSLCVHTYFLLKLFHSLFISSV